MNRANDTPHHTKKEVEQKDDRTETRLSQMTIGQRPDRSDRDLVEPSDDRTETRLSQMTIGQRSGMIGQRPG
jgi:hypothetical protein